MSDIPFAVALELDAHGAHPAASSASAGLSPRLLASRVAAAERFGFTAVTFEDSPLPAGDAVARLDGVQRAAFVAPLTSAIGLVPVAHVAFSEPFHVATQLASLDWASNGRAGWIAEGSGTAREAAAYGREALTDAELARERHDVIEVARRLWDSWEDDAVIRDAATGRYLDADKLHYVDFEGDSFSVKGPLITPRPPQGQPVVVAPAGTRVPTSRWSRLPIRRRSRMRHPERVPPARRSSGRRSRSCSTRGAFPRLDASAPSAAGPTSGACATWGARTVWSR